MGHVSIKKDDKKEYEHIGYMIGTEYLYELGSALHGASVYPDIESIYEALNPHGYGYPSEEAWPQDGIVEVKIQFIRHIAAEKCWEAKQQEEK